MLKCYNSEFDGQDPLSWEENWADASIDENVAYVRDNDHLRPVLDRYIRPDRKVLEGGCGLGQYVIYYSQKGVDIQGVDFAPQVINRIKAGYPDLPVEAGDVQKLRFDDNFFDVYYSGGVVEHFEEGPHQALREAHRVLKKNGVLIITVPFVNFWRQLYDAALCIKSAFRKDRSVRIVDRHNRYRVTRQCLKDSLESGFNFYLYIFSIREFMNMLKESGFKVISWHGCSVIWGLRSSFGWVDAFFKRRDRKPGGERQASHNPGSERGEESSRRGWLTELLKDILIREKRKGPYFPLVVPMQRVFGNLAVFICEAQK